MLFICVVFLWRSEEGTMCLLRASVWVLGLLKEHGDNMYAGSCHGPVEAVIGPASVPATSLCAFKVAQGNLVFKAPGVSHCNRKGFSSLALAQSWLSKDLEPPWAGSCGTVRRAGVQASSEFGGFSFGHMVTNAIISTVSKKSW